MSKISQPSLNELTFDEKYPKFLISGEGFLRIQTK